MRWISNIYDPRLSDAKDKTILPHGGDRDLAWHAFLKWVDTFTIGPPKATEQCSREQLEGWNMVGLYDSNTHEPQL